MNLSNIKIGNNFGSKFDKIFYGFNYMFFKINTGVKLTNYNRCVEYITKRPYEKFNDFLPKNLIIDVGAQYCDYSLVAAKKYNCDVIAFEPVKENYIISLENIRINKMENKITLYNDAVGSSSINGGISKNMFSSFSNGIIFNTVSLDSIIKENPYLIKIDVEGFEMNVLNSMINLLLKCKPKIIIETHSSKLFDDVNEFLKAFNYKLKHSVKSFGDEIKNNFYSVEN